MIVYGTQTDLMARLGRASLPMFNYEHAGLADITETIRTLGDRIGRSAEGRREADRIEQDLADIRAARGGPAAADARR